MLRTAAEVLGLAFITIGVLGFIPAVTPDNHLFGIFYVDTLHNIVHLASGLAALAVGYSSALYFGFGLSGHHDSAEV